ncbi:MAG: hypothetical protein A2Y82_04355 [Candidatus Buchananbacteria bacterium RBG_13_36_9]|uniref:Uncharacterized protein n=1 Tax=Candidatus Buchananbacteria bacterium RBG_13_36_9 TaxID=1797530 RepID=A0A1G1XR06_9BACT|nr:MAG: hypothetical protein A2Y82_04355 [Candidatus Buchananbacteria bacterium RBG_13_36_9]
MKKDIKEIFKNSGNNFHYKVVSFLREKGWNTTVSPYYNDNFTDKPREIDIIAEKNFPVQDVLNRYILSINIRFFIECKYINEDAIFWFDNCDNIKARQKVISETSIDNPENWSKRHRYLDAQKVAKLFESSNDRNIENQTLYKALTQSLNSLVYYKELHSIIPPYQLNWKTLNYPIILCSSFDKFYNYDIDIKNELENIKENFLLEINYAYIDKSRENQQEYFLIDIVAFDNFENFINEVESKDLAFVKEYLYFTKR